MNRTLGESESCSTCWAKAQPVASQAQRRVEGRSRTPPRADKTTTFDPAPSMFDSSKQQQMNINKMDVNMIPTAQESYVCRPTKTKLYKSKQSVWDVISCFSVASRLICLPTPLPLPPHTRLPPIRLLGFAAHCAIRMSLIERDRAIPGRLVWK